MNEHIKTTRQIRDRLCYLYRRVKNKQMVTPDYNRACQEEWVGVLVLRDKIRDMEKSDKFYNKTWQQAMKELLCWLDEQEKKGKL